MWARGACEQKHRWSSGGTGSASLVINLCAADEAFFPTEDFCETVQAYWRSWKGSIQGNVHRDISAAKHLLISYHKKINTKNHSSEAKLKKCFYQQKQNNPFPAQLDILDIFPPVQCELHGLRISLNCKGAEPPKFLSSQRS